MKIILPPNFEPPLEIKLGNFSLEALHPKHNERDFEALSSIKKDYRGIIDPNNFWPDEVLSLEDNLKDLTKDYQEFLSKLTFRYSILSTDKASYNGCLYIRPTKAEGYDACIEFWFKSSKRDLEKEFFQVVSVWLLSEWGFKGLAFPGREISWGVYGRDNRKGAKHAKGEEA